MSISVSVPSFRVKLLLGFVQSTSTSIELIKEILSELSFVKLLIFPDDVVGDMFSFLKSLAEELPTNIVFEAALDLKILKSSTVNLQLPLLKETPMPDGNGVESIQEVTYTLLIQSFSSPLILSNVIKKYIPNLRIFF